MASIRQARGLSGAELSRRIGVHPSLLSKVEHGRIDAWPRFRQTAATALAVDEALLFGAAEEAAGTKAPVAKPNSSGSPSATTTRIDQLDSAR